MSKATNRQCH